MSSNFFWSFVDYVRSTNPFQLDILNFSFLLDLLYISCWIKKLMQRELTVISYIIDIDRSRNFLRYEGKLLVAKQPIAFFYDTIYYRVARGWTTQNWIFGSFAAPRKFFDLYIHVQFYYVYPTGAYCLLKLSFLEFWYIWYFFANPSFENLLLLLHSGEHATVPYIFLNFL